VLPKDTFYPYNWNEDTTISHPASYVTHAWDGSWIEEDLSARSKQSDAPSISTRAKSVVQHIGKRVLSKLMPEDDHFKNPNRYTAEGTLCVETVHDFKILLQGSDLSITPHVTTKGCYERKEEDFINSVLRGGDYFVDVGANVGVFTLLAAQMVGPFGRVFAFEPNPTVADLLRRSAVMNWWHDRVVVSELGVGADNSDAIMHLLKYRNGDSRVTQEPSRAFEKTSEFSPETEQINIQITSLDQYFPYNVPIRFLKVDVEGFEDEVLQGASRLISNRCIDYIMVETIREVADDFDRLLALLATLINGHYGLYALDHNNAPVQTTVEQVRYDETPGRNLFLIGDWVQ
jgi:FkbM family methyltransferase